MRVKGRGVPSVCDKHHGLCSRSRALRGDLNLNCHGLATAFSHTICTVDIIR